MRKVHLGMLATLVCVAVAANGAETITYSYDAKGRLVKVVRSGAVNNSQTEYQHDKADNRAKVKTTGAR